MAIQWSLVFFAAFICWGAGTYLMTVVFHELFKAPDRIVRPAFALSAIAVIVGAIASMTHLGHLDRIFGVLSNPASGIFVEGLSSALLVIIVAIYLVAASRNASAGALRAIAIIGAIPALVVTIAVGTSYLMVARPAWNVVALPVISLTAALSMGAVTALAMCAFTAKKDADGADAPDKRMATSALALIVVQAVALVAYVVSVGAAPYQDATRSAARMLMGDMAPLFWIAVVILGIAVPFAATLVESRRSVSAAGETSVRSKAALALGIAVVCMVIAVIAFRVIMFSMGSSIIDFEFTM